MKRVLTASTALCALTSAAVAQTNIGPDASYDEIIVTAQKRDQVITDVPAAITAFTQDDLDYLGVQQFDDLADFIPGLEVQEQSANNPGFVIRGITSDSGAANIEPRVSIFQDGVSTSRSRGSFVEIFDTEVEVLRGPQPTLFGRSALIGAIALNSIRPEIGGELSGFVRAGYGNLDFTFAEGGINIPVTDTFAVRVAGRYKRRDGYIDSLNEQDDFQGFETYAVRTSALWEPTEDLSVLVIGNYQEDNNPGTSFKSGTFRPAGGSTSPFSAAELNVFGGEISEGKTELGLDRELWNVTGRIDYTLNEVLSVTSITSYRDFDSDEIFDPDGFGYNLFLFAEDAEGQQFSQELRLNYDNGQRLAGFIGVNYFDEEGEQRVPLRYDESIAQALLGGFLFTDLPGVEQDPLALAFIPTVNADPNSPLFGTPLGFFEEEFRNTADSQSYEIFADATFALTDRIELTGGVRYTFDDKETGQSAFSTSGSGSALTGAGIFLAADVLTADGAGFRGDDLVTAEDEFEGITGRFGAKVDVTDDLTVFANYSRGRRPEVLNYNTGLVPLGVSEEGFEEIDAETVNSFEVGARGTFFDNVLRADGSFYYYDYNNFQTSVTLGVGDIQTVNAGGATAYGFEGTTVFTPTDWLSIFGNYAWNDATFDDESDDGQPQAFAGNRFRLAPEHALSVGVNGTLETKYGTFNLRPIYTYRSEIFFDDDNDRQIDVNGDGMIDVNAGDLFQDEVQEGYGVLDIRATWTSVDERFTLEVFAENVTDKEYLLDAGNTGDAFGIATFIAAAPATYGFYVSTNF
ncbi:MAG: TonB-dependent receptor [Pseudomonadota bacterium]